MKIEIHDPRPESTEELARQTAIELRKRGIWAQATDNADGIVTIERIHSRDTLRFGLYGLYEGDFDNLGPVACADVIQAEEAHRAQEWAGDSQDITDPQKPTKPAIDGHEAYIEARMEFRRVAGGTRAEMEEWWDRHVSPSSPLNERLVLVNGDVLREVEQ